MGYSFLRQVCFGGSWILKKFLIHLILCQSENLYRRGDRLVDYHLRIHQRDERQLMSFHNQIRHHVIHLRYHQGEFEESLLISRWLGPLLDDDSNNPLLSMFVADPNCWMIVPSLSFTPFRYAIMPTNSTMNR